MHWEIAKSKKQKRNNIQMEISGSGPPPPPPRPPVLLIKDVPGDESEDNRFQKRVFEKRIDVEICPLHECLPGTLDRVYALLSERWPKSDRSTSQIAHSCSSFPTSLVLFEQKLTSEPLGHVLLSRCVEDCFGLLAESVLVTERLRGGGLGRRLMELTHEYARVRGFKTVYLCSRDKRDFYGHMGYVSCNSVSVASAVTTGEERSSALNKLKDVFGGSSSGKFVWMSLKL
jgi:predicted N-acetyltransferase YhbS